MIEMRDVGKTYRLHGKEVNALDGVNLRLKKGSFNAVVGSSGCGKSTLLMVIGALIRPSRGVVKLDEKDLYGELSSADRAGLRAGTIGFVFQNFHLVPYLSTLENVLVPSLAVGTDGAADRAQEMLTRFGLSDRSDHCPEELSMGEKQRTALARALINQPKLLLADEPTGNLDPDNSKIVLDHIAEYHKAGGTVLMVTHDRSLCEYAQRTVRLEGGKLVED